jgi:hypothetical protein
MPTTAIAGAGLRPVPLRPQDTAKPQARQLCCGEVTDGEFRVDEWAIGSIVFACVFGGALAGIYLRSALPKDQLGDDSKDAIKLGMGLVATMSALVLGLLVATAKGSYDDEKRGLDQISANLILLDGALAEYGPEAQEARLQLHHLVDVAVKRLWPEDASHEATVAPPTMAEGKNLHSLILGLTPDNDGQRALQSMALQIGVEVGKARWLLVAEQEGSAIPAPFIVILIFWLTVLFVSFGLFAPPNATVVATLFLSALSVSGAVFLIMELAHPFAGMVQISSAPLRTALSHLAQ